MQRLIELGMPEKRAGVVIITAVSQQQEPYHVSGVQLGVCDKVST
jgi:hypothetical protein